MGDSELNAQTTMKFALVVCFAALVACEPEAKPEAEADPWLGYYGYGAHPYAYGYGAYGLGYGYHGLGYRTYGYGYPYAHHGYAYYGKRSADAEPEPKADADAYYGYYGYGARP